MNSFLVASAELGEEAQKTLSILDNVADFFVSKSKDFVGALIVFIVGWYIIKFICKLIRHSFERAHIEAGASSFLFSLIKGALVVVLFIVVIQIMGVNMTSIIALLTSASLAIGLALQGCLSNLAGGLLILLMKPFVVGDYIIDGRGNEGTVVGIEVIYTRILTIDNKMVSLPNGALADSTITNLTKEETRRIDFEIGIDYNENIGKVREVLLRVAEKDQDVLHDPVPEVFVSRFDQSAVTMLLRLWVETDKYWPAKFSIQEGIKEAFDANCIVIPYEHLDVNLKRDDERNDERNDEKEDV